MNLPKCESIQKKLFLVFLILILVGGAVSLFLFRQTLFPATSTVEIQKAQEMLEASFLKSLEVDSVQKESSRLKLKLSGLKNDPGEGEPSKEVNGELQLDFEGKLKNFQAFLPDLDYAIGVDFKGALKDAEKEEKLNLQAKLLLRILERNFYGKLETLKVQDNSELEALIGLVKLYENKWYTLAYSDLLKLDPEMESILREEEAKHPQNFAKLKKFVADFKNLLLVTGVRELDKEIAVQVKINWEVLFSRNFLNQGLQLLDLPGVQAKLDTLPEEKLLKAKEIAQKIEAQFPPTITLKIEKESGLSTEGFFEFQMDFAQLKTLSALLGAEEIEELPNLTGKLVLQLESKVEGINEEVQIVAPPEATDLKEDFPWLLELEEGSLELELEEGSLEAEGSIIE